MGSSSRVKFANDAGRCGNGLSKIIIIIIVTIKMDNNTLQ